MRAVAEKSGIRLCGPNCYGIYNAANGAAVYSGILSEDLTRGPVGLILQSGAISHSILETSQGRGPFVQCVVTSGNELMTGARDYLEWMVDNPDISTIGLYLERLGDPQGFGIAAARAARAGKSIVALMVGSSERGKAAALAHTGAVIGGRGAMAGYMSALGIHLVEEVDEFRETLILLSGTSRPRHRELLAVSISGAAAATFADTAARSGLDLPDLRPTSIEAIGRRLPLNVNPTNPLDMTGAAADDMDLYRDVIDIIAAETGGAVIVLLNHAGPRGGWIYRRQAEELSRLAQEGVSLITVAVPGGDIDPGVLRLLAERSIPLLMGARPAATALRVWATAPGRVGWMPLPRSASADLEVDDVVAGVAALQLLSSAGITCPSGGVASDPWDAATLAAEYPESVLKLDHPTILHKSEMGAVAVGVTPDQAAAVAQRLLDAAPQGQPPGRVLVQRQVCGAVAELLVGVALDEQVGLCLTIAPGGTDAELFGHAASRPLPVDRQTISTMLEAEPLRSLLRGYRGKPAGDIAATVETIAAFGDLIVRSAAAIGAAEINPLMVMPEGQGTYAVDARFIGRDSPAG